MVSVSFIYWVGFSFTHIRSKWFPSIVITSRIIWLSIVLNEILNERIWASRIIRWVRQGQDIFIFTNGESLDLAKLRIFEFFAQFPQEILATLFIAFESYAETFHWIIVRDYLFIKEIARFRIARDQSGFKQLLLSSIISEFCHSDPRFGRCH